MRTLEHMGMVVNLESRLCHTDDSFTFNEIVKELQEEMEEMEPYDEEMDSQLDAVSKHFDESLEECFRRDEPPIPAKYEKK